MVNIFSSQSAGNRNVSIHAYKGSRGGSYERYDFVHEKIQRRMKREDFKFLDMGCGDGGFLFYLRERHPRASLWGVEISRELMDEAKANPAYDGVQLVRGDVLRFRLKQKFDAALMSGVLSIFDDIRIPLANMARHLAPGGYGYVFGGFCSRDIDVLVRYRNHFQKSGAWESGLNMFCFRTVREALKAHASKVWTYPFKLHRDLERRRDPIRTFTVKTADGRRLILNGANMVREFYLVEFLKKG